MTALQQTIQFLEPFISTWNFRSKPLVLSVSGPQGSGKSYLSSKLIDHLKQLHPNLFSLVVSTDDLYLTHADQKKLNEQGNPLLRGRGLPGTHDLKTGYEVFSQIVQRNKGFKVPTYDKSAFNGEGDRGEWVDIDTNVDLLIVEGWFNGFIPIHETTLDLIHKNNELLQHYKVEHVKQVNENLKEYTKIWELVDLNVFYDTNDINNVYNWRIQQEHDLISRKGTGMTDHQVRQFIQRYMVVYELYYRQFTKSGWLNIGKDHNLRLKLENNREISKVEIF